MKRTGYGFCIAAIAAFALACGGEEGPSDSGAAATTAIDSEAEDFSLDDWDDVETASSGSVHFSPDPPVPGDMLRALVNLRGAASQAFTYTWTVAGHRLPENSSEILLPSLKRNDRVEVAVSRKDGSGEAMTATTIVGNSRPKLLELSLELTDAREGEVWQAEAWGSDPDGDALTYEFTWFVNGERLNHEGATYPAHEMQRGDTISVRAKASDGEADSSIAQSGTAEVANTAPDFVSTPPPLDASGVYHYQAEASDPDGDRNLKFELVEGPEGMEIGAMSGIVSWTPTPEQAGRHSIEIAVQDRYDGRTTQSWVVPIVIVTHHDQAPAAVQ